MTRRRLETRQAGTVHTLGAVKPLWSGERRGFGWTRGALGAAMHWRLSNHTGAERDSAFDGGVAGWELPFTGGPQSTQERRAARRTMGAWQAGSSHSLPTPKAVWFTGGWWLKHCMGAAAQLPVFLGVVV